MSPTGICKLGLASTLAVLLIIQSAEAAQITRPLPEAPSSTVGYQTVEAAHTALRARHDVVFTAENGWTIATDEAAYTIWSFAPAGYPAYPAVVKRQVVTRNGVTGIGMAVLCEATKVACDELVRTFAHMNGFDLPH